MFKGIGEYISQKFGNKSKNEEGVQASEANHENKAEPKYLTPIEGPTLEAERKSPTMLGRIALEAMKNPRSGELPKDLKTGIFNFFAGQLGEIFGITGGLREMDRREGGTGAKAAGFVTGALKQILNNVRMMADSSSGGSIHLQAQNNIISTNQSSKYK